MTDRPKPPHPDRLRGSGPEPFNACPDGGRCWHGCPGVVHDGDKGLPCWRVLNASPFTVFGDRWPDEEREAHQVADDALGGS